MKLSKLNTAIAESERFLERARTALEAHKASDHARLYKLDSLSNYNPRENGALRRSSMDLTRALADLRKPD